MILYVQETDVHPASKVEIYLFEMSTFEIEFMNKYIFSPVVERRWNAQ
jgi:hypothetical protein